MPRNCASCKFWHNGGPGRDACLKPLTKAQVRVIDSLPAAYTVLGGQVHASSGSRCPQWKQAEGKG